MIQFESEQSDFTEDKYTLAGHSVSQLENAGKLEESDMFLVSQHEISAKILYDVADVVINETVPYVEDPYIDPYHDQTKPEYQQTKSAIEKPAVKVPQSDPNKMSDFITTTADDGWTFAGRYATPTIELTSQPIADDEDGYYVYSFTPTTIPTDRLVYKNLSVIVDNLESFEYTLTPGIIGDWGNIGLTYYYDVDETVFDTDDTRHQIAKPVVNQIQLDGKQHSIVVGVCVNFRYTMSIGYKTTPCPTYLAIPTKFCKFETPTDEPDNPIEPIVPGEVTIQLSNQTINNIYIKTTYEENGISAGLLAKWQYTTATKLNVILPPEPKSYDVDQTYDYYFHFCWINQIVYPMNSYDQWPDRIYPKLKHCIDATIYDAEGNLLSTYEFRNLEHEDCFSMVKNDDGINILTKYKGVADLRQREDDLKITAVATGRSLYNPLNVSSDYHVSYKDTYQDFKYRTFYDISAGMPFGSMSHEDQDQYALVKHLHDYSFTEVYPYYTEADANGNLYNLIGIVHLSNSVSSSQISIWLPEIEEPLFFEDHMIGELKPIGLNKGLLPAIDLDSKYFDGWVYCDGASYPKEDFPEAYEVFRYAEGSTKATFKVPYYNTHFIKSNPNLPEFAADPVRKVKYHNIFAGKDHDHGGEGYASLQPGQQSIITSWRFPATGPDKDKIRKKINDGDEDYYELEYLLDEKVNTPCATASPENRSKYKTVIHGAKMPSDEDNVFPTEGQREGKWWSPFQDDLELDPVDTLTTLEMAIPPGTSKGKIRNRYATRPYIVDYNTRGSAVLRDETLDGESYPSYKKIPMMVYIGRKVRV